MKSGKSIIDVDLLREVQEVEDIVKISRKAKRKIAVKRICVSGLGFFPFLGKIKTLYRIPLLEHHLYNINPQN